MGGGGFLQFYSGIRPDTDMASRLSSRLSSRISGYLFRQNKFSLFSFSFVVSRRHHERGSGSKPYEADAKSKQWNFLSKAGTFVFIRH